MKNINDEFQDGLTHGVNSPNNCQKHENSQQIITIYEKDLPLSCPMPNMLQWNAHPRVFLEIEKTTTSSIICPYCSTKYILNS